MKTVGLIGLGFLFLLYVLLGRSDSTPVSKAKHVPSGSPPVVMVTVFNSEHGLEYKNTIKENRNSYAQLHGTSWLHQVEGVQGDGVLTFEPGYETFFAHIGDYDLHGAPMSWTRVVAMRHALTKFPDASYVWFLGQDSLIMDPKISIHRDIMGYKNMDKSMLRSQPVALPESIIKTSRQLAPDQVELALTQDKAGMSPESLILKNGEFAEFFLDTWYDPLFRSYNFKKAEVHALVSSPRLWAVPDTAPHGHVV